MKVYIIEYSGCEFGGVEHIVFQLREDAEAYVNRLHYGQTYPKVIDYYEVIEVDLV